MEEKNLHVRIVPMTADHLDEVAELERICFSTPWSRNMLAEELDNYLSAFLVALDDNDKVAATPACRRCWTRAISPMWLSGRTAGSRALPESCCKCFLTLLRPTIWRF